MLYLLNKDVRTVRWNGEPLHEATSAIVKETMNGDFTLTVKYPISDSGIYQLIKEDMLIKALTPVLGAQLFRIKKPVENNDHLEITAYHISDDVMQRSITPVSVTSQSCGMALSRMVQNTKTALGDFSFNSDIQDRRTFNTTETETLYSILLDGKHSIVGTWEGELVRDNFAMTVKKSRGENRGVVITTHKNLKDYQRTRNSQNVVTRIHAKSTFKPEGSEKETTLRVTVDSPLINSYPYINEKEYENNNAKTVEELQKWAQSKFSNEGIDKVSDAIKIEAYELDGQVVHMGDTVNLKSWKHNVDAFKKAIAYEFDALKEEYISLTFDDKAGAGGSRASGGLSSAADAILGVTESAQEIALEKALQNADLDFDHKAGLLRHEISDGIELGKARAEEVKRELSATIDQRFNSFNNGPLQEAKRRAEEALRNAGASTLLAQEAKRIGLDSVAKLEEFKTQATSAQMTLSSDLDALANEVLSKQEQIKDEVDEQVEALVQTKKELAGVKSAQATYEETTTRRLSELTNLANGKASKSELMQTAEQLASKIASVQIAHKNQGDRVSVVESNFRQRADALDAGVSRLTEGLRTKADISALNVTAENIRQSVKSLETSTQNKLNQMLSMAEFEVRAGSIRQEILNATKDKADKTLVVAEAGKLREEFSKMKVGSRNYAEDYDFSRGLWVYSQGDSSPVDWKIINGEYNVKGTTNTWKQMQIHSKEGSRFSWKSSTALLDLEVGETYTLSFQGICYSGSSSVWLSLRANRTVSGNPEIIPGTFNLTSSWQTYQVTIPALTKPVNFDFWRIILGYDGIGHVAFRKVELTRSSTRIDAGPAPEDGKTDLIAAKATFERTAQGLRTDLSAIQEYVNKGGQRQEALQRYTREESAKQATAVRELVAKDYVGKATYQEDVKGINQRIEAVKTSANKEIASQIASYRQSVDGKFTDISSQITTYKQDVGGQISGLSNRLTSSEQGTTTQISNLSNRINSNKQGADTQISNLKTQIATNKDNAERQMGRISDQVSANKANADSQFSNMTNQLARKVEITDFQRVQETSLLYERILGNTENGIINNVARMAMTNQLFQVEVSKNENLKTVQRQLAGSWAVQNLTSAGSIVSQINATNNQILIEAEKIRLKGKTLLDELTAIQGYFKRLFVGEGTFATLNADIIRTNSITADKLVFNEALANRLFSNEIITSKLVASRAFVNALNAVTIDASQIVTGTLKGDRIYGGTIRGANIYGGTLTGHTKIQLGSYGSFDTVNGGLQINVPRDYNAKDGLGVQFIGSYGRGENVPYGLFIYKDSDFTVGGTVETSNEFLLTVEGYINANGIGWMKTGKGSVNGQTTATIGLWNSENVSLDFGGSGNDIYYSYNGTAYSLWSVVKQHFSDRRLKENIVDCNHKALDYIQQFQFKEYDWKKQEDRPQQAHTKIGLIAQEVQAVDPTLVYENGDTLNLDNLRLTTIALKAIQELSQRIETLERKLA